MLLLLFVGVCLNPLFSNLFEPIFPHFTKYDENFFFIFFLTPLIFSSLLPSEECDFLKSKDPVFLVHFHIPGA